MTTTADILSAPKHTHPEKSVEFWQGVFVSTVEMAQQRYSVSELNELAVHKLQLLRASELTLEKVKLPARPQLRKGESL